MEIPQISDGDWKTISDQTSVAWNVMRETLEIIERLREQAHIIERNRYYQERVLQTPKNYDAYRTRKGDEQTLHALFLLQAYREKEST